MSDYNTTQSDYREKCKARIQRQLEISELMWYYELKAFNLLVLLVAVESWILKGNTKLFKMQNFNFCRLFLCILQVGLNPCNEVSFLVFNCSGLFKQDKNVILQFFSWKVFPVSPDFGYKTPFSWRRFRHNVSCYGKLWDFEAFTWNLF